MNRFAVLVLAALLLLSTGCGKKGDPTPRDAVNQFAWKAAKAEAYTDRRGDRVTRCLAITADLTGAAQYVERFVLEVEPQTPDVCVGCPFLPAEMAPLEPLTTRAANNVTRYTFDYCPVEYTAAYRWRLVAHSIYKSAPYAFSKVYGPTR